MPPIRLLLFLGFCGTVILFICLALAKCPCVRVLGGGLRERVSVSGRASACVGVGLRASLGVDAGAEGRCRCGSGVRVWKRGAWFWASVWRMSGARTVSLAAPVSEAGPAYWDPRDPWEPRGTGARSSPWPGAPPVPPEGAALSC